MKKSMFKMRKPMAKKYIALAVNALRRMFMNPVKNVEFTGKTIILDFARYEDCKFIDCRMVYFGLGSIEAVGCSFIGGAWEFNGPAANSLGLLKIINQEAPSIIDMTFGIRRQP